MERNGEILGFLDFARNDENKVIINHEKEILDLDYNNIVCGR